MAERDICGKWGLVIVGGMLEQFYCNDTPTHDRWSECCTYKNQAGKLYHLDNKE